MPYEKLTQIKFLNLTKKGLFEFEKLKSEYERLE
jgi:hypothetical protein